MPNERVLSRFLFKVVGTPFTITTFVVVAISGLMLFFKVGATFVKALHEWLSLALVVGCILHIVRNWQPIVSYARKRALWVATALTALAVFGLVLPAACTGRQPRGDRNAGTREVVQAGARLLGSLWRTGDREVTFLRIVPTDTRVGDLRRAKAETRDRAHEEAPGFGRADIVISDDPVGEVVKRTDEADLTIIGVRRETKRRKYFGPFALKVVSRTRAAIMLISRHG